MNNVTFLNCKFYDNSLLGDRSSGYIYILGGTGDDEFIQALESTVKANSSYVEVERELLIERYILEKFWPVGRETVMHKHRPIKGLCGRNSFYNAHELYETITNLKKRGILLEPRGLEFVEINFELLNDIRSILGRAFDLPPAGVPTWSSEIRLQG